MKEIITGLFFIFCFGLIIWAFYRKNVLLNDHKLTSGIVVGCRNGTRGDGGGVSIKYRFEVNGKSYQSSNGYSAGKIDCLSVQEFLQGKSFPIVYNPSDPSISALLIRPEDFKRYQYHFPDSLSWTVKLFKN